MFRGVPRASERLGTPRNTSEHLGLPDLSIPGTNGRGVSWGASPPLVPECLSLGIRALPRCSEVFRGVPRPRNASEHLGTPRNTSEHLGLPDLSIPGTNGGLECLSLGVWRFSEVFRGVPRPRNASEHLGTPRETSHSHSFPGPWPPPSPEKRFRETLDSRTEALQPGYTIFRVWRLRDATLMAEFLVSQSLPGTGGTSGRVGLLSLLLLRRLWAALFSLLLQRLCRAALSQVFSAAAVLWTALSSLAAAALGRFVSRHNTSRSLHPRQP